MNKFDIIVVLDLETTWEDIRNYYAIDLVESDRREINDNMHGNPNTELEQCFRLLLINKWDFKLYEYAVHMGSNINC